MNRRALFKRLGAAAAVAAMPPMTIATATEPLLDERQRAQALYDRWLASDEGQRTILQEARRLLGENDAEAAYQRGLEAGLNGAIDQYFDILNLATVTAASAEGRYVARMTDRYVTQMTEG